MSSKDAVTRRAAPRSAPLLNRTPAGRRSFVLRMVRDRVARTARDTASSPKAS